jgi:class 3 adenylate cyclase
MATARAERRLAAIMAADVTGYSRLVEADEAGTPAAIRDVRREVIEPLLSEHHEGSIQKQDEQIRATAQLVHAATGAHVWSERWDRPARDLFAVQTEIAELVANQLGGWGVVLGASNFGHPNCGAGTADRALRLDPN